MWRCRKLSLQRSRLPLSYFLTLPLSLKLIQKYPKKRKNNPYLMFTLRRSVSLNLNNNNPSQLYLTSQKPLSGKLWCRQTILLLQRQPFPQTLVCRSRFQWKTCSSGRPWRPRWSPKLLPTYQLPDGTYIIYEEYMKIELSPKVNPWIRKISMHLCCVFAFFTEWD